MDKLISNSESVSQCFCVGPRLGQSLCPCALREAQGPNVFPNLEPAEEIAIKVKGNI